MEDETAHCLQPFPVIHKTWRAFVQLLKLASQFSSHWQGKVTSDSVSSAANHAANPAVLPVFEAGMYQEMSAHRQGGGGRTPEWVSSATIGVLLPILGRNVA